MTTYQTLLLRSGTLELIEEAIKRHSNATVADAAREDKKTISEIKDALKMLNEQ